MTSVAPLAGAWIEMIPGGTVPQAFIVAPLAGAWIEIMYLIFLFPNSEVAPLAGAWIEIPGTYGTANL
mgnify:CR=1 FL=1